MATKGDKPLVEGGLSFINQSRQTDDSVNKNLMVAGVHNDQNLLHINRGKNARKVSMVAGAPPNHTLLEHKTKKLEEKQSPRERFIPMFHAIKAEIITHHPRFQP